MSTAAAGFKRQGPSSALEVNRLDVPSAGGIHTFLRWPRGGATMVAKLRCPGSFAAVSLRLHIGLSCGNACWRTFANPQQPSWQCGGQGFESPQLHSSSRPFSRREGGLSRFWMKPPATSSEQLGPPGLRGCGLPVTARRRLGSSRRERPARRLHVITPLRRLAGQSGSPTGHPSTWRDLVGERVPDDGAATSPRRGAGASSGRGPGLRRRSRAGPGSRASASGCWARCWTGPT